MADCTQCGAELGVGRFCINCGHPVGAPAVSHQLDDWRTGTAERAMVMPGPVEPPPVHEATPPVRYPLFADEPLLAPAEPPAYATGSHRSVRRDRRRVGWWAWAAGTAVLVLVAGLGAVLMLGGDDSAETALDATSEPTPTDHPGETPSEQPPQTQDPTQAPADGDPTDVARFATPIVPATAPPSEDGAGNAVRYEGRNMLDGVPETAWRMPGDGTGETLTFELGSPTTMSEVGLVNGYAKTAGEGETTLDWYAGNRRILAVEWLFDDGTMVRQDLAETRALQTIPIGEVTTESVQLRLVTVTPPGRGRAARDYTAVSEVSLVGVTG